MYWEGVKASLEYTRDWLTVDQIAAKLGVAPVIVNDWIFAWVWFDNMEGRGEVDHKEGRYKLSAFRRHRKQVREKRACLLSENFRRFLDGKPQLCWHRRKNCKDCKNPGNRF